MSHHYHDQPRVPKGRDDGGQWTRDPYGPDARLQPVLYRQQPPRGLYGPGILPPPTLPPDVVQRIISGIVGNWLSQFEWLSLFNRPDQRAIVEFRAREYPGRNGVLELTDVRTLDRQEVRDICKKLGEVQTLTDLAAKVASDAPPAIYGTAVHNLVKEAINGPQDPKKPTPPRDPNFRAEVSYVKSVQERDVTYGTPGSIRVDVYERVNYKTACIYDIKTGNSRLGPARMLEIATVAAAVFRGVRNFIVTEVKPGDK